MNVLISGLVNTETTVRVRQFPVEYYPIDYPFFGVKTAVSGVAWNIALAMKNLGDDVSLLSMTGQDFPAAYIRDELRNAGIDASHLLPCLRETPASVVLYDDTGKRQIYCDLKDIQETTRVFPEETVRSADLVVACNINFNRPLLRMAKEMGKTIATDVHVLRDIWDEYNREFIENADILFLSDEGIGEEYHDFLWELVHTCNAGIIVLGRGSRGAAMYDRAKNRIYEVPAAHVGDVVNTVGAGDALFSSFVHYTARGYQPLDALRRAVVFAAAKIRESGASRGFITEAVVEAYMQ
ncbi:MAG: carbohydrate kinase family protein [Oscillospiraceae bacterium]|nr:carbohydrate kinase family protein [Oscillospiraceae bacterium]